MNISIMIPLFILYVILMSGLAYYGYRKTTSEADYLVGGRNINPIIMALSYGATLQSTSAIIGFGGVSANLGFGTLWLAFMNILFGIFVAFALFGTRIRKLSVQLDTHTFSSLLGKRYQSKFITVFSGAMIFLFMPAYTGVVLIGGGRYLQETLNMNFDLAIFILAIIVGGYVISGGIKAVMYTDAFAAFVMLIGMIIFLIIGYHSLGGVFDAHSTLTAMENLVPESLVEQGHQGWTSMPEAGSPLWWTMISTIIMGVGIGVLAQPQLVVRTMTVKNNQALHRSVLVGGIFMFFLTSGPFMLGAISNVQFYNTTGEIAVQAAGGNIDLVIPMLINGMMPDWFLYLFTLTLISLAISTISSLIHVQASAFGEDILKTLGITQIPGIKLSLSRLGVIIGMVGAVFMAYFLPSGVIAQATSFWFGICGAGFLPTLVGALYWKRASRIGAISSISVGFASSVIGYLFFNAKVATAIGLSSALFGKETLLGFPLTHIHPLLYALPISTVVFIVVSLKNPTKVDQKTYEVEDSVVNQ